MLKYLDPHAAQYRARLNVRRRRRKCSRVRRGISIGAETGCAALTESGQSDWLSLNSVVVPICENVLVVITCKRLLTNEIAVLICGAVPSHIVAIRCTTFSTRSVAWYSVFAAKRCALSSWHCPAGNIGAASKHLFRAACSPGSAVGFVLRCVASSFQSVLSSASCRPCTSGPPITSRKGRWWSIASMNSLNFVDESRKTATPCRTAACGPSVPDRPR